MDKVKIAKMSLLKLIEHGYQAYLVGGFVRDTIMGRPTTDIDIATDAKPEEVMNLFKKAIPTGLKHGTITVIENGLPIEITTFRREGKYLDFRRPSEIKFVSSLIDDLSRRDFTMNAIAMDLDGQLIDPFQGKFAIQNQTIKSVGNPKERFLEDPLRMLRAVRFASQLSFFIEKDTQNAIIQLAPFLQYIAIERVKIELNKIINSNHPEIGFHLLFSYELDRWFKGMISDSFTFSNKEKIYNTIGKTNDFHIRWALLMESLDEHQRFEFMKGLRFPNYGRLTIYSLFRAFSILQQGINKTNITKCYIEIDEGICKKAIEFSFLLGYFSQNEQEEAFKILQMVVESTPIRTLKELKISGRDILRIVCKPAGPWVHQLLQKLFEQVIYYNLPNEYEELIEEVVRLKGDDNK